MTTTVRAKIAHTPRNPFACDGAPESFDDGALAFAGRRVVARGEYRDVRAGRPEADVLDARDTILLHGFVDCHVHYPQRGLMAYHVQMLLGSEGMPVAGRGV